MVCVKTDLLFMWIFKLVIYVALRCVEGRQGRFWPLISGVRWCMVDARVFFKIDRGAIVVINSRVGLVVRTGIILFRRGYNQSRVA